MPITIQKPGYATARHAFAAAKEEYVVVLHPPVRVSGRIIDAATRKSIGNAHVTINDVPSTKTPPAFSHPAINVDGEGRYEATFNEELGVDSLAWQICVQSVGYVTALSRRFGTGEGSRTIDIELLPGPAVAGVVKRPDGTPLAGAKVFVSTASSPATIENGELSSVWSPPEIVERTTADGRFALPMPLEPYVVGVLHDFGGAEISAKDLKSRGEIVVQPWARVVGVV